jgi:hypothetical protein
MLVPNAPNVTVGTFCVGCMLYLLSVCDVEGGGSHLDGPWCPVEGGGIVVSKGGCVVDGIFANLPAFAMLEATSYFFSLPSFLFLWQCAFPLRAAAVAVLVAMLTGAFFLLQLVLHLYHRLSLFELHACCAGFAAFPVVMPAGSVSGFAGRRHRPVAAKMP